MGGAVRKEKAGGRAASLPWPSPSSCLPRQAGQTPDSLGETRLRFRPPTRLLHSPLQARASPVAAFPANDVDQIHMGEHRVSVHGIGQRVRFAPFERPRGEGSKALSVRLCGGRMPTTQHVLGCTQPELLRPLGSSLSLHLPAPPRPAPPPGSLAPPRSPHSLSVVAQDGVQALLVVLELSAADHVDGVKSLSQSEEAARRRQRRHPQPLRVQVVKLRAGRPVSDLPTPPPSTPLPSLGPAPSVHPPPRVLRSPGLQVGPRQPGGGAWRQCPSSYRAEDSRGSRPHRGPEITFIAP